MVGHGGAEYVGKDLAAKIIANVKKGAGLYFEHSGNPLHFKALPQSGALGNGRVFRAKTAGKYHAYLPSEPLSEYGKNFFPRRRFLDPQVVADAVEAAFG